MNSGFPVHARGRVCSRAHGFVIVGVAGEPYTVGNVHVGLERVADVVVEPASDAVHGVARTGSALADQIVPEPIAGRRRQIGRAQYGRRRR